MNEFIKHIRNVQFYLLGSCFVFVATTWTSSQYLIRPALKQIQQIEDALNGWTPEALLAKVNQSLDSLNAPTLQILKTSFVPKTDVRPELHVRQPDLYNSLTLASLDDPTQWNFGLLFDSRAKKVPAVLQKPGNLAEFARFWNELNTTVTFVQVLRLTDRVYVSLRPPRIPPSDDIIKGEALTLHSGRVANNRDAIVLDSDFLPGSADVRRRFGIPDEERATHFLCANEKPSFVGHLGVTWQVAIAVDQFREVFTWQPLRSFCDRAHPDWRVVKFDRAFPELVETTSEIDEFRLDQLTQVLQSRLDEDYETLELFGAKFPVAVTLLIGSPLILLLQLYLLLHLGGLNDRIQSVDDLRGITEPWIGLYRNQYARWATFLVIGGVPWTAQLCLLVRGFGFLGWISISAMVVTVLIAIVVSWKSTQQMHTLYSIDDKVDGPARAALPSVGPDGGH